MSGLEASPVSSGELPAISYATPVMKRPGAVPSPKSPGEIALEIILYAVALSCFIGAFYLFGLAIRLLHKAVAG